MEAFIACITAAGPPAKRPPHIGLAAGVSEGSEAMGSVIEKLLLMAGLGISLAACGSGDKGKPGSGQAGAGYGAAAAAAPAKIRINMIDRSHAGTAAPNVVFERGDGSKTSLADYRGKRVLVNLWATWCAPCLAEMPELDALAAAKKGQVTVLPLSQDMEGWQAVKKFFKPGRFQTLVPLLDQPGSFAERMGARGLPMSILYDERGREVWRVAGTLKWATPEVRAAL
jgi:thiol-disulfide isomerase/thioredoxin